MASRLQITPVSDRQAALIEMWALSEGRSVSSLGASLLDQAVTAALSRGEVPAHVVEGLEEIFEPEREIARLTAELNQAKTRNEGFLSLQGKIATLKEAIEEEAGRRPFNASKAKKTTKKEVQ